MTLRTMVQDGLIIVNTHGTVPDGTPVKVSVGGRSVGTKATAARTTSRPKARKSSHVPGFGMWADRDELGSPEVAVQRLRALTRRRRVA